MGVEYELILVALCTHSDILVVVYWYPLGQRKVILHVSIMTFVSVIPAMVHQNLDSVTN